MPKSREMPQRSIRSPLQLKMISSESDPPHSTTRATVDRSPKLSDRRSPRSPVAEKKRGTRISDLEFQLGQAQEELKKMKEQLATAEAAKRDAEQKLEDTIKQIPATAVTAVIEPSPEIPEEAQENGINSPLDEPSGEIQAENNAVDDLPETDVFEVPALSPEPKPELVEPSEPENGQDPIKDCSEIKQVSPEKSELESNSPDHAEIADLKAKLKEKEKELESFSSENDSLKLRFAEVVLEAEATRAKEEEAVMKLSRMSEELEESKSKAARTTEQLKAMEEAKLALEVEMKRLRVQTEQWRKAADAAAAVLAAAHDGELNGRVTERCGSMDKQLQLGFEPGHYAGFGSPAADEFDDGLASSKRKGGAIRKFGDLWKKKGQK